MPVSVCRRLLTLSGLLLVLVAVSAVAAGSAQAYALTRGTTGGTGITGTPAGTTGLTGTLVVIPTGADANSQVVITVAEQGANVTFTPQAESVPAGSGCSSASGSTVCPSSDVSTAVALESTNVANVTGLNTQTLRIVGTPQDDQFDLSAVTLTDLDLAPQAGDDGLNATGTIKTMQLDGKAGVAGSMSMNLNTGPTTGSLNLGGGNSYVYAPTSMLSLNSTGASTLCAGGTIVDTGAGTIHAVSPNQTITGSGQTALDYLAVTAPMTLTMEPGGKVVVASSSAQITGIQSLTGSSGNDTLIASGVGADILNGGPGNDTFVPNTGPDVINGGGGTNTIDYSPVGITGYSGVSDTTPLTVDLVKGLGGPTGQGPVTQDQLTSIQSVTTNNADDSVIAGNANGTFSLGNGNDSFSVGTTGGDDVVTAGNGNDTLTAGAGNTTFTVGNGTDTLTGGAGNDTMTSGTGNDTFIAGMGTNTITGGGGNDTVSYANRNSSQGVTVTLSSTGPTTGNGQPGENDSLAGIVNIIGGGGYNILTGDNQNNTITGGSGGNTITDGNGNDTINGGSGNDIIVAGSGSSTINGNGGNDQINAFAGVNDHVNCGTGSSVVTVNPSDIVNPNCTTVNDPDIAPPQQTIVTPPQQCVYAPGQECGGIVVPYPEVANSLLSASIIAATNKKYVKVGALGVVGLTGQAGITLTCRSPALRGCPFQKKVEHFAKPKALTSLTKLFRGRKLTNGTRINIQAVAPQTVGLDWALSVQGGAMKSNTHCIHPVTGKLIKCPAGGYLIVLPTGTTGATGTSGATGSTGTAAAADTATRAGPALR